MEKAIQLFVLAVLLQLYYCQECEYVEQVYDGTFSFPSIDSSWSIVGGLPGGQGGRWSSNPPNNGFEIWQQGALQSPPKDANGRPTGQHLQINGNQSPWAEISYEFNVPCLLASISAFYSFQYWYQPEWNINNFGFTIQQSGEYSVQRNYPPSNKNWTATGSTFVIKGCQPLKLTFTSSTTQNVGVHIDNVSLTVKVCQSVEMVVGGSFNEPPISDTWQTVASIPSGNGIWMATPGTDGFVLWKQGAMEIPSQDAFGFPTGQHLELNGLSPKAQVSYQFYLPFLLGTAETVLSFKRLWMEGYNIAFFGAKVVQGGATVLYKELSKSAAISAWKSESLVMQLQPTQAIQVYFICDASTIGGLHIDNVSLKITENRNGFSVVAVNTSTDAVNNQDTQIAVK